MSIASISSVFASLPSQTQARIQARIQTRLDLNALQGDLQANNVTGAQQDFASLLKDAPQFQNEIQSGATTPQATALSSLSAALQSGNLPAAQSALTSLQATLPGGHHPFYAGGVSSAPAAAALAGRPSLSVTF